MPIITEQMLDTNTPLQATPQESLGNAKALQQLGATATDIMLNVVESRTKAETQNAVSAFDMHFSRFTNEQVQKLNSQENNWSLNGDEIKQSVRKAGKDFTERAAQSAPNDVAREQIRRMYDQGIQNLDMRMEAIHADKVLGESKRLYNELAGSAVAEITPDTNAVNADNIYKSRYTTLSKLRETPYTSTEELDARDTWFTSTFSEQFARTKGLKKPLEALSTFSPELGMFVQNYKTKGNLKDATVNPFADLAYRQGDSFYYTKYNPTTQAFSPVKAEIDASLYPDAAYINTATKEVVVSNKQLMSSPRTPQFVKDLYKRNPEKAIAITNNLLEDSFKKIKEDASLQQLKINDNYKKSIAGEANDQLRAESINLGSDPSQLNSMNTRAEALENYHKAITPYAVGDASNYLKKNPVGGESSTANAIKMAKENIDKLVESKDPRIVDMITAVGNGDYEAGKEATKANQNVFSDQVAAELTKQAEQNALEYKKDPSVYERKLLPVDQQEALSYYFSKGMYEDKLDPTVEAKLLKIGPELERRTNLNSYHVGLDAFGMTKGEEDSFVSYMKSNTNNPEKQDNAVSSLTRIFGVRAITNLLDRNGLSSVRNAIASGDQVLRTNIYEAKNSYESNKKILEAQGEVPKEIDLYVDGKVRRSELLNTLAAGSGANQNYNVATMSGDIKAIAYQNMVKYNMNKSDATKKAISDFENSFDIISDGGSNGKFYLYSAKGKMGDKAVVKDWIENRGVSRDYLEQQGIEIPEQFRKDSKGLYNETELRAAFIKQISGNTTWYTNGDGTGAILNYRTKDGKVIPVMQRNLKGELVPFERSWEAINSYKTPKSRQVEVPFDAEIMPQNIQRNLYRNSLEKAVEANRIKKESLGIQGISHDTDIETSAAATLVDPQWLNDTLKSEGESLEFAQSSYTFERLYAEDTPKGFLHSMRVSNFDSLNSPQNVAIVGETPVYRYTENGKKYISYLPLSPKKWLALSEEDKKRYFPTVEAAIKKTLKNWTRVSTNPEAARFMQGQTVTQRQFHGIADVWHTLGATKLLGGSDPVYKKLGDTLRNKDFKSAISMIQKEPLLFKELGMNKHRFNRLVRYWSEENV